MNTIVQTSSRDEFALQPESEPYRIWTRLFLGMYGLAGAVVLRQHYIVTGRHRDVFEFLATSASSYWVSAVGAIVFVCMAGWVCWCSLMGAGERRDYVNARTFRFMALAIACSLGAWGSLWSSATVETHVTGAEPQWWTNFDKPNQSASPQDLAGASSCAKKWAVARLNGPSGQPVTISQLESVEDDCDRTAQEAADKVAAARALRDADPASAKLAKEVAEQRAALAGGAAH